MPEKTLRKDSSADIETASSVAIENTFLSEAIDYEEITNKIERRMLSKLLRDTEQSQREREREKKREKRELLRLMENLSSKIHNLFDSSEECCTTSRVLCNSGSFEVMNMDFDGTPITTRNASSNK